VSILAKVRLIWTCDNEASIYFDGKLVDHDTNWSRIKDKTFEIEPPREVMVKAKNYGGPAGFACIIYVDDKLYIKTDGSWRCDGKPVYVIPHSYNPWKKVGDYFRKLGAEWIWSSKEGAEGKKEFEITMMKTVIGLPSLIGASIPIIVVGGVIAYNEILKPGR